MDERHVPLTIDAEGKVTGVGETALTRALRESREREENATRGPWVEDIRYLEARVPGGRPFGEVIAEFRCWAREAATEENDEANARFAAHARTWEPRFRKMVEAARGFCSAASACTCEVDPAHGVTQVCVACAVLLEFEKIAREGQGVGRD